MCKQHHGDDVLFSCAVRLLTDEEGAAGDAGAAPPPLLALRGDATRGGEATHGGEASDSSEDMSLATAVRGQQSAHLALSVSQCCTLCAWASNVIVSEYVIILSFTTDCTLVRGGCRTCRIKRDGARQHQQFPSTSSDPPASARPRTGSARAPTQQQHRLQP